MRLPNAENALLDARKLTEYSLNERHERGEHKAKVFRSALGVTLVNHEILLEAIRQAILTEEAQLTDMTEYGARYAVDFEMVGLSGQPVLVRSTWIFDPNSDVPRLTNCFIP